MNTPRQLRVAVLGGGISGCTLAAELGRSPRVEVTLVERGPRLGGLHRSCRVGPYVFDIGAFVFEDDHSIFSVFPEVREMFPRVPNRYGSIRDGGVLDDYPISIGGLRRQFGAAFLIRVLAEILVAKVRCHRRDTLRRFVEYYMGPTLYRESGLQRYIERLYLARDSEIDLEFAEKRLAVVAEAAGVRQILARLGTALLRGRGPADAVRPLTAKAVRVRPPSGFEDVYERIAAILRSRGVTVLMDYSIQRILRRADRYELVGTSEGRTFDHLFSTIPIELMARLLGMNGFTTPEYMDLYSLFYECLGSPGFSYNVLHNFTASGQWKRLTVLSRYYGPVEGRCFFTVEGTAVAGRDRVLVLREAGEDFEGWCREHGLFGDRLRLLDGVVTSRGYPVYRTRTARGLQELKRGIAEAGIRLAGRQGGFNYVSSSDAAGDARRVARSFLGTVVHT